MSKSCMALNRGIYRRLNYKFKNYSYLKRFYFNISIKTILVKKLHLKPISKGILNLDLLFLIWKDMCIEYKLW